MSTVTILVNMAFIKAISVYFPETVTTNEDLCRQFPEWSVDKVCAKVGVSSRHVAAADETAGDLAEKAARRLFDEYSVSPNDVDFLLLCTESPDYFLPPTACVLQHRLGLPTTAGALDYDLGCSGCIYGLALAKGLIAGGIAKNVLLLTAETYTKYIHPDDKGNRSIFGDGAAACLISTDGFAEIGEFVLGTDGSRFGDLIVKTGAARHPFPTGHQDVDDEGHDRRDDFLYMNGGNIFNFTLDVVPLLVEQVLKRNCLEKQNVDYYVFHQANAFMLNALRKVCAFPKDKFYIGMEDTGNTVSSSVFIGIKHSLVHNLIKPGMNVMIAGFGVGLSWGGTMLRLK